MNSQSNTPGRTSTSRHATQEYGLGKLTLIVFSIIIGVAVYSAYHIMPFYYNYFELQNQAEQLTRVAAVNTDTEIREKLWAHIEWMEMPIDKADIQIKRWGNSIKIEVVYSEFFDIEYQDEVIELHRFDFHVEAESAIDGVR